MLIRVYYCHAVLNSSCQLIRTCFMHRHISNQITDSSHFTLCSFFRQMFICLASSRSRSVLNFRIKAYKIFENRLAFNSELSVAGYNKNSIPVKVCRRHLLCRVSTDTDSVLGMICNYFTPLGIAIINPTLRNLERPLMWKPNKPHCTPMIEVRSIHLLI